MSDEDNMNTNTTKTSKKRMNSGAPEGKAVPAPHVSCYSSCKPGDKSWKKKWPDCDYDERNISVVTCDTDTPFNITV